MSDYKQLLTISSANLLIAICLTAIGQYGFALVHAGISAGSMTNAILLKYEVVR